MSAWEDKDKESGCYREYFTNCSTYSITNFGTDQGVLQNSDNEIFLDLEGDLDPALRGKFSTVFNHTTLEHVWDFRKAFANLCHMSSDCVILVVPWLQPLHATYGDYWRFSPQAVVRLFEEQDFEPLYLSWTTERHASVYVFAIASRNKGKWDANFVERPLSSSDPHFGHLPPDFAGSQVFC